MLIKLAVAALSFASFHASAADDAAERVKMTDDEKIEWYCGQHPDEGANCTAHARQLLPYISDFAKYGDTDTRGNSITADPNGCDFSPLPPGCPSGGSPAPAPGGSVGGGAAEPGVARPFIPATGSIKVPESCTPGSWGGGALYRRWRCLPRSGGHGMFDFNAGPGTRVTYGFVTSRPPYTAEQRNSIQGRFNHISSPALRSHTVGCQYLETIVDANGLTMCTSTSGDQGQIIWSVDPAWANEHGESCGLKPGTLYFYSIMLAAWQDDVNTVPPYPKKMCATLLDKSFSPSDAD
jgi:hypothetical protein